MKNKANYFV